MTAFMVVSKRDRSRCELQIGDVNINQVQTFSFLGSVITNDGKYNPEILQRI